VGDDIGGALAADVGIVTAKLDGVFRRLDGPQVGDGRAGRRCPDAPDVLGVEHDDRVLGRPHVPHALVDQADHLQRPDDAPFDVLVGRWLLGNDRAGGGQVVEQAAGRPVGRVHRAHEPPRLGQELPDGRGPQLGEIRPTMDRPEVTHVSAW